MRGFLREFEKTFLRLSCFGVVLAALVLNACLFCTKAPEGTAGQEAYRKANAYLAGLPKEELSDFLAQYGETLANGEWEGEFLFSGDLWEEQQLVREFGKRAAQIEGYPAYLEEIQKKAGQQEISIFQKLSEYTKRDLAAAAKAFRPLMDRQVRFVNSDAVLQATEFAVTDILALAVLFYLVVSMVIYEKEHGLFGLLRATKCGRGALIGAKMAAGACGAAVLALLFWAGNLALAFLQFGAVDLSAPLQSVYGYDGSALPLSIGQYLLVFLGTKMVIYAAVSFLVLFLGMKASNTMEIYLGAFLILVISGACYAAGVYSGWYILHYVNLIFFVRVFSFYRFYFNLNFFGYPVSILVFSLCCMALLLAGLWGLNWRIFAGERFASGMKRGWRLRTGIKHRINVSVFSHERYKLFAAGHGWVLLLAFLLLTVWMYGQKTPWLSKDERYYKNYMERLAGPLDGEKEAFLKEEEQEFLKYEALLAKKQTAYEKQEISEAEMGAVSRVVSEKLEPRAAFERVCVRAAYAREHGTPLVYESGYLELLGYGPMQYREDMAEAGMLVIALILLAAPFFAMEYSKGMIKLVSTQYAGRRTTLLAKGCAAFLGLVLICLMTYAPRLILVGRLHGYAGLCERADAIEELAGGFWKGTILGYLAVVYLLRFAVACVTLALVTAVAVWRKNIVQAVSVLFIVLAFPLGLHLLGMTWVDFGTLNGWYSVNWALNQREGWRLLAGGGVLLALLAGSLGYLGTEMGE